MDERIFQEKLSELMEKIRNLPQADQSSMRKLAEQSTERRQRLQASVTELQESLDHLRLSVKYLIFDLEATRRENAYLRKLLDRHHGNQGNDASDHYLDDQDEQGAD